MSEVTTFCCSRDSAQTWCRLLHLFTEFRQFDHNDRLRGIAGCQDYVQKLFNFFTAGWRALCAALAETRLSKYTLTRLELNIPFLRQLAFYLLSTFKSSFLAHIINNFTYIYFMINHEGHSIIHSTSCKDMTVAVPHTTTWFNL